MLNDQALEAVYDDTAEKAGTPPKLKAQSPSSQGVTGPSAPRTVQDVIAGAKTDSPVSAGGADSIDVQEYGKYLDQGVYAGQDIDSQRGQKQTWVNKVGHAIANMPGNIIGSLVEGVGDLGLLAKSGDDRNYTNALIEAGKSMHDASGELYNRNAHATFGQTMADPTWWIQQVAGAIEMGVSYGVLGAGIAKLTGTLAQAANALHASEGVVRTLAAAGQMGSAGLMAYTMGAQSAGNVFQKTYDTQFNNFINQGLSPNDAHDKATHIAAQSAATTAQLTTAIGTVLGLTGMAPYFSTEEDVVAGALKKDIPALPGETNEAWAQRVKSLDPDKYKMLLNPSHSVAKKLSEMGKMGVEMMQLQFGEKTGEDLGQKGKVKGFADQFGELESFFDRTMDKDGATAFLVGAGAGFATEHVRQNYIPAGRFDKIDATTGRPMVNEVTGENQKAWLTPKAFQEMYTRQRFNNVKETVAADIDHLDTLQKKYVAASAAKDPVALNRAADDMFNINNFNAITMGQGKVWRDTYEDISNLQPDDAAARGYASDYKERATKAMTQVDSQQKIYDDLQSRYGTRYAGNSGLKDVVDGIFARKASLDNWNKDLVEHESKLAELTKDSDKSLSLSDPNLYDADSADHFRKWNAGSDVIEKIQGDHDLLSRLAAQYDKSVKAGAIDTKIADKIRAMAHEYSAIDEDQNNSNPSLRKSVERTLEQMSQTVEKHKGSVTEAELKMQASSGYAKWKEANLDVSFDDYLKKLAPNVENQQYASQIELGRSKYKIAEQNLAEVTKERNLNRFAKKASDYFEQQRKEDERLSKAADDEIAARVKDQAVKQTAENENKNVVARAAQTKRDAAIKELADIETKLDTATGPERDQLLVDQAKARARAGYQHKKMEETQKEVPPVPTTVTVDSVMNKQFQEGETPIEPGHDVVDDMHFQSQTLEEMMDDDAEVAEVERVAAETVQQKIQEVRKLESMVITHMINHPLVENRIVDIQNGFMDQKIGFSYDLLNNQIKDGTLTSNQAAVILQDIRDYVNAAQDLKGQKDFVEYQQTVEDETRSDQATGFDIIGQDIPEDIPVEVNQRQDMSPAVNGLNFVGYKTVDANTIANSTHDYVEFHPNRYAEIEMHTIKDALNLKTSKLILSPSGLKPSTAIKFMVDTEYNGKKTKVGEHKQDDYGDQTYDEEKFEDFADEKGKVSTKGTLNVPIKIVDAASGETIGYVRTHRWVTERYKEGEGQSGLRNIAEKYDEKGNEVNGARQAARIIETRRAIVEQFNANGGHIDGKITSKSNGHPIFNTELKTGTTNEKSKIVAGYAFNHKDGGLLPDKKIIITVFSGKNFYSGKDYIFDRPVTDAGDIYEGGIFTMLPSANGEHFPVPLVGNSLGHSPIAAQSLLRAITVHLKSTGAKGDPHTDEAKSLAAKTGFDITTTQGLKDFINQYYTHTADFRDTATVMDRRDAALRAGQQFMFQVKEPIPGKESKANVKVGTSYSGQPPVIAAIDPNTGELTKQFVDAFTAGINTRTKTVVFSRGRLRGINESASSPFLDAKYVNGGWQHTPYEDYNQYVKSFSKTTIYGKPGEDGSFHYAANPALKYEMTLPQDVGSPNLVESNETPTTVHLDGPPPKKVNKFLQNTGLSQRGGEKADSVKEIGTPGEKSKPLTIANLEELYNFTPEEQRNGKVPSEMLKTLTDNGHTGLSEGYNPFSLCL